MNVKVLGPLVMSALLLGACGSSGGDHSTHPDGAEEKQSDASPNMQGEVPGAAADASQAKREIEVTASDDLVFDPSSIEIPTGEVVTFVVRNEGKIDHEFVLGDEAYQAMHERDMEEGHHMSAMENAITIAPGETGELTWEFMDVGSLEFGCHEPGHYDGGMVGTIEVG